MAADVVKSENHVRSPARLAAGHVAEVSGQDHGLAMGCAYSGHPTVRAAVLADLDSIQQKARRRRAAQAGPFLHGELQAQLGELSVADALRRALERAGSDGIVARVSA